jgi:hypothetical protein
VVQSELKERYAIMGNGNKANVKHGKIRYCKMKEKNTNKKESYKRENSARIRKRKKKGTNKTQRNK